MIDRVRVFMHRPLADSDRARLFLVAVVAIVLGAAVLALLDDPPSREPDRARPPGAAAPARADASALALALPSEEGDPPAAAEASPGDVRAAKLATRRFVTGYLRFSYGQARTGAIDSVSDELRRRLETEPPRVPPSERARQPRIVLVQAEGVSDVRASTLALVSDGARRYTVRLELERRRSGWLATDVGS